MGLSFLNKKVTSILFQNGKSYHHEPILLSFDIISIGKAECISVQ